MTDCNGCGCCCDPVVLAHSLLEVRQMLPGEIDAADKVWILDALTPLTRRQVGAKVEYQRPPPGVVLVDAVGRPQEPNYYACRHFDPIARSCTNYEHRPPVCRGYPWHGGPPRRDSALPFECSFRADIGQEVRTR